jgi:hypothetical protein
VLDNLACAMGRAAVAQLRYEMIVVTWGVIAEFIVVFAAGVAVGRLSNVKRWIP